MKRPFPGSALERRYRPDTDSREMAWPLKGFLFNWTYVPFPPKIKGKNKKEESFFFFFQHNTIVEPDRLRF